MNDLKKAILTRKSRRSYLPTALDEKAIEVLNQLIDDFSKNEKIKMQLLLNNGEAFNGLRKSYGMLSGVKHCVVQICNKDDVIALEKMGYFGELLVLKATDYGLGTCWVGGTYDPSRCPVELNNEEAVVCTIVVGNVQGTPSGKEKFIYNMNHRKTKPMEQMYVADGEVPNWFIEGMKAVEKAPSAANRQPITFSYKDGIVTAAADDIEKSFAAIDLGIAKLHFEIGAGGGKWEFGNGAKFTYDSKK